MKNRPSSILPSARPKTLYEKALMSMTAKSFLSRSLLSTSSSSRQKKIMFDRYKMRTESNATLLWYANGMPIAITRKKTL